MRESSVIVRVCLSFHGYPRIYFVLMSKIDAPQIALKSAVFDDEVFRHRRRLIILSRKTP